MSLISKFRQTPTPIFILHITAKFVFGVWLGVLLADYLSSFVWLIFLLALAMGIPGLCRILGGK